MHTYIYIYIYISTIYTYARVYFRRCLYGFMHMYTHTQRRPIKRTCVYVYLQIHMYTRTYEYTHVYIYICMYTYNMEFVCTHRAHVKCKQSLYIYIYTHMICDSLCTKVFAHYSLCSCSMCARYRLYVYLGNVFSYLVRRHPHQRQIAQYIIYG